jgi:hypothetical protein
MEYDQKSMMWRKASLTFEQTYKRSFARWSLLPRSFTRVRLSEFATDGRLSGREILRSPICQVFNDLPRLWFLAVSQKVS